MGNKYFNNIYIKKKLNTHIITMNAIISSFVLAIAVCSINAQPLGGLGARFKTPSQVLPVIGTENPIGALGGPGISYGYGPSMGGFGGGIGGGIGIGGGLPFGGMMGFGCHSECTEASWTDHSHRHRDLQ